MANVSLASPLKDQAAVVQVRGMDPDPHSSSWDDFVGAALLSGWDEPLVGMPGEQGFAGMVLGGKGLTAPLAIKTSSTRMFGSTNLVFGIR